MPKVCPVCRGSKKITLPLHEPMTGDEYTGSVPQARFETFDCPKCVRTVPYRRVRALKIISAVDAVDFGRFQMPMQRKLAAQFGEYLMREGLIWFTTDNLDGPAAFNRQTVEVSARCNVVSREGGEVSGAEGRMEAADAELTTPQKILNQMARRKQGLPIRDGVRVVVIEEPEEIFKPEGSRKPKGRRDRVREDRERAEAMGNRFSGLELDDYDD